MKQCCAICWRKNGRSPSGIVHTNNNRGGTYFSQKVLKRLRSLHKPTHPLRQQKPQTYTPAEAALKRRSGTPLHYVIVMLARSMIHSESFSDSAAHGGAGKASRTGLALRRGNATKSIPQAEQRKRIQDPLEPRVMVRP
jgi:hypothetical protein